MDLVFYRCKHCGKIIVLIQDSGVPTVCCNDSMEKLEPSFTDGNGEKHLPIITNNGSFVLVQVGAILHPSTKEHHIEWIVLVTDKGFQFRKISEFHDPIAKFIIATGEKIISAYAFCNIHGLWKNIRN